MRLTVSLLLLLSIASGCAEPTTAPLTDTLQDIRHGTANYAEEGEQAAPAEAPEEYRFPTMLYSVEPDAGYVDGHAYAQAIVSYFGTNALAKATVSTKAGADVSESESSDVWPGSRDHMTSVNVAMDQCSGTIRGTAYGKVWNEFPINLGIQRWGTKSATKQVDAQCKTAPPGSDSGRERRCYTIDIDYYWYYPDTGEIDYRYTDTYQVCENYAI